ncbi:MAG TPA: NADH:flavin oxidoreductase [Nocardioidaceae bacterium]|nr:NADH:flavin oxidoreductase [Nocardioidaceae bacterium]
MPEPSPSPLPAARPDVFAPALLGPIRLRNRVVKAATFEGRTPDALVTDDLIDYHLRVARGGVGMTTVAYLAVAPEGRTDRHQIYLRDEALPGLQRLTEALHAEGAAVAGQLGHAGPVANGRSNRTRALSASRMPSPLSMQMVRAATEPDIARVTADYVAGARLAARAGFDCLELHMGHNYLLSAFLSPLLNRRKDRWGGSLDNRARFARQVATAVREAVGSDVAVTAKLSMSDGARGGFGIEESIQLGRMLESDGALDALELSAGSSLMNPMYLFRGDAPRQEFASAMRFPVNLGMRLLGRRFLREYPFEEAYLLPYARRFREALDMPLILLGGINRRDTMEQAMAEGFEYVAMARALLREPDLVVRMQQDHVGAGVCTHCNRCMPTIYTGTHCPLAEPAADSLR